MCCGVNIGVVSQEMSHGIADDAIVHGEELRWIISNTMQGMELGFSK